jgi:hypothetical protein
VSCQSVSQTIISSVGLGRTSHLVDYPHVPRQLYWLRLLTAVDPLALHRLRASLEYELVAQKVSGSGRQGVSIW